MARGDEPQRAPLAAALDRCRFLVESAARDCHEQAFSAAVADADDALAAVAAITDEAWRRGGLVLASCHGVMHTVGREYAQGAGVTPATLMEHLPRSNDPGCSAGFAHGVVTAVAPRLGRESAGTAATACMRAETRYRRYSCVHGFGHAFMRVHGGRLPSALDLCAGLGRDAPDCAQGAYHDYWFAVAGADDAPLAGEAVTDPRRLCAAQAPAFVRPCWYRAYVETRPEGFVVASAEDVEALCHGLSGLQRSGCVTAASVIGPADPLLQLELCAGLPDPADAESCVRGTKVQNLRGAAASGYVRLAGGCELVVAAARSGCYRWLGTALAVVTDGTFVREGCPRLASADARAACREGARASKGALITFS